MDIDPTYSNLMELMATCVCYEGTEWFGEQFIDIIPTPAPEPETCRYYHEERK